MQFIKPFTGVRDGEIYPEDFEPGDECPAELLDAAISLGAVEAQEAEAATVDSKKKPK